MNLNNYEKIYLNIINEEAGIKVLYLPNEIMKFNFKSFNPFEYHNVSVFQSATHNDINHVLNRLNERSKKHYKLNDIFAIIKRGIDEYLKQSKTTKFNTKQSFNIISKSYKDIRIACAIEKNTIKSDLIFLEKDEDNKLYHNDYFCFIYTILESTMKKRSIDRELIVESYNTFNLYVK